jgi:sec-independent protein translocase protein TatA
MFGLGPTELIIIAVIILFIFGAKRLPGIGKAMGETVKEVRNIKKAMNPKETAEKVKDDNEPIEEKDSQPSFETKVVNGVLEQIPGVRKFKNIKKKAEKLEKWIE